MTPAAHAQEKQADAKDGGPKTQWTAPDHKAEQQPEQQPAQPDKPKPADAKASPQKPKKPKPLKDPPANETAKQNAKNAAPAKAQQAQAAAPAAPAAAEGGDGQFLAVADLNSIEMQELVDVITAQARAQLGYHRASLADMQTLPAPPAELQGVTALSRSTNEGQRLIQLGYKMFISQPPHLWLYGQTIRNGQTQPNDDLAQVQKMVEQARQGHEKVAEQLHRRRLESAARALELHRARSAPWASSRAWAIR